MPAVRQGYADRHLKGLCRQPSRLIGFTASIKPRAMIHGVMRALTW